MRARNSGPRCAAKGLCRPARRVVRSRPARPVVHSAGAIGDAPSVRACVVRATVHASGRAITRGCMDQTAIIQYVSATFAGVDVLRPTDGPGAGDTFFIYDPERSFEDKH